MKKVLGVLIVLATFGVANADEVALTVYNGNLGVVSETRSLSFDKGIGRLAFTDVPALIDPASVRFSLKSGDGVSILEQNYQFDLVNASKMMTKYVDKEIQLVSNDGEIYSGILLSAAGDKAVLSQADGAIKMVSMEEIAYVDFPRLPDGLITRPTLFWLYNADAGGKKECNVSYQTSGISWSAEYVGVLNDTETELDWSGWSSIDNRSGKTYTDAKLKLVAGEINRAQDEEDIFIRGGRVAEMAMKAPSFQEKAFFEYHLYTLPRPATVADNEIKQISLFEPAHTSVTKKYRYLPDSKPENVDVTLTFLNSEKAGLGMPLPEGRVRIFKADDADGSLILLGEDQIDHTPTDEEVELVIGSAFDIVAEYRMKDQQRVSQNVEDQTFEIELRNRKDEDVTVEVEKKLYGFWDILKSPVEYEKKDANTITFKLTVPAGSTMTAEMTVRFTRR